MLLINTVFSSLLQLIFFSLPALVLFLVRNRKFKGFLKYLGFFKPPGYALQMGIMSAPLLVILGFGATVWPEFREIMLSPGTVAGEFRGYDPGLVLVLSIFISAVVKTALAEEIFFRAFLGRELVNRWGFPFGNAIQAFLFGITHVLLFRYFLEGLEISSVLLAVIFVGTCAVGYVLGYLQLLVGRGSIIPNWIAHALTNLAAFLIMVFYF